MTFSQRCWYSPLFSYMTQCTLVYRYQRVRGRCRLYLHGSPRRLEFLWRSVKLLRSVDIYILIYTASYSRISQFLFHSVFIVSYALLYPFHCVYLSTLPPVLCLVYCHYAFRLGWPLTPKFTGQSRSPRRHFRTTNWPRNLNIYKINSPSPLPFINTVSRNHIRATFLTSTNIATSITKNMQIPKYTQPGVRFDHSALTPWNPQKN
jgi:hypothetical protein